VVSAVSTILGPNWTIFEFGLGPEAHVTFQPGDVVQIKAPCPMARMTVREVRGDAVLCQWFEGKELWQQWFIADYLVLADATPEARRKRR
jgi:uncharacterized protein YodC (DUF2158 family)